MRLVKSVELWLGNKCAELFGVMTGGIYILPVEIYDVTRGLTWPKVTVLVVNICVVSSLFFYCSKMAVFHHEKCT